MSASTATSEPSSLREVHERIMAFIKTQRVVEPGLEQVTERVTRAVADLLLKTEPRDVLDVLGESQDVEVLLGLLEHHRGVSAAIDPSEPTLAERLTTVRIQGELLEAAGGTLSVSEAASLLGIQDESVRQRIRRGTLLGLRFRGPEYHLPSRQFEGGRVLQGLGDVLKAMPVRDAWTQLGDLIEPLTALGDERSLLDLVREGETAYAVELASRMHETGGL